MRPIRAARSAASALRDERARTATVTARLPSRRDSEGVKRKLGIEPAPREDRRETGIGRLPG